MYHRYLVPIGRIQFAQLLTSIRKMVEEEEEKNLLVVNIQVFFFFLLLSLFFKPWISAQNERSSCVVGQ